MIVHARHVPELALTMKDDVAHYVAVVPFGAPPLKERCVGERLGTIRVAYMKEAVGMKLLRRYIVCDDSVLLLHQTPVVVPVNRHGKGVRAKNGPQC